MSRSRHFCFTLNNYTDDAVAALKELDCKYLVFGKEKGDAGTPHLQGYVSFAQAHRFNTAKKLLPAGSHLEAAKGSAAQNTQYCSKENDIFTKGDMPMKGTRNDIKEFTEVIRSGKSDDQLIDLNPGYCARYNRHISFVRQARLQRKTFQEVKVTVLVGPPDATLKKAYEIDPDLYNHTHQYGNWFCAYNGEATMLIHNFNDSIEPKILCPLLSGFPLRIPVKCYHSYKAWDHVVITTELHPREWSCWSSVEKAITTVSTIQ